MIRRESAKVFTKEISSEQHSVCCKPRHYFQPVERDGFVVTPKYQRMLQKKKKMRKDAVLEFGFSGTEWYVCMWVRSINTSDQQKWGEEMIPKH